MAIYLKSAQNILSNSKAIAEDTNSSERGIDHVFQAFLTTEGSDLPPILEESGLNLDKAEKFVDSTIRKKYEYKPGEFIGTRSAPNDELRSFLLDLGEKQRIVSQIELLQAVLVSDQQGAKYLTVSLKIDSERVNEQIDKYKELENSLDMADPARMAHPKRVILAALEEPAYRVLLQEVAGMFTEKLKSLVEAGSFNKQVFESKEDRTSEDSKLWAAKRNEIEKLYGKGNESNIATYDIDFSDPKNPKNIVGASPNCKAMECYIVRHCLAEFVASRNLTAIVPASMNDNSTLEHFASWMKPATQETFIGGGNGGGEKGITKYMSFDEAGHFTGEWSRIKANIESLVMSTFLESEEPFILVDSHEVDKILNFNAAVMEAEHSRALDVSNKVSHGQSTKLMGSVQKRFATILNVMQGKRMPSELRNSPSLNISARLGKDPAVTADMSQKPTQQILIERGKDAVISAAVKVTVEAKKSMGMERNRFDDERF